MMELRIALLLAAFFALIVWTHPAQSKTLAVATHENISVSITDEPCALPAVKMLQNRATWTESGKTFEGCAGAHPLGLIILYFNDGTIVLLPPAAFKRVEMM